MLSADSFTGLYAIIPTPARPGADALFATDTVDLDETERLINAIIRDGAAGLIVLGTTGECATLSETDFRRFTACVVETVGRRVPAIVGASALGGHQVADRLRYLGDIGADGTMLGLPMWQPLTMEMAVNFYGDVSEAFPGMPVMVYANARAFRFNFPLEFWRLVSECAQTVVAAKCSRAPNLAEMIEATGGRIHFMPSDMVVTDFRQQAPATTTSCWATAAAMNPAPSVALINAVNDGREADIQELKAAIDWANAPMMPMVADPEIFASYNLQVEKTRINTAGYSKCGPIRPPYHVFPEQFAEPSREAGRRWAQICAAFDPMRGFSERPWLESAAAGSR